MSNTTLKCPRCKGILLEVNGVADITFPIDTFLSCLNCFDFDNETPNLLDNIIEIWDAND